MKNSFLNSIKIIALAAIFAAGVSYVSAWTAPGVPATNGNTIASVNESNFDQTKTGSFTSESFLKAGGLVSIAGALWNNPGFIVGEKALIAPWGFFKKSFLPGSGSQVKIGSPVSATPTQFNNAVTPFTIDLIGRGSQNNSPAGRQVIDLRADTNMCYPNTTIRTNTPGIQFLNTKTGNNADVIARQVQLSGGSPQAGMILVSTDSNGNAVWGTPTLDSNGKIKFTYGNSPAAIGQNSCTSVPPVDVCTNALFPGNQSTIPGGYHAEPAGSTNCVPDAPAPVCGSNVDAFYKTQTKFDQRNIANDCAVGTADADTLWYQGQANWTCVSGTQSISCSTAPVMDACFTADTYIAMADGSHKLIQDVQAGDKLKAVSGINTVLKLLRPKLGNQPVYSINGGREFFTANHPFLTTQGWKSIDPEITRKEIPSLKVEQLKTGDVLITEKGNIPVKQLAPTSASADTQLFNFELDGDHTYYADGYAVHNKEQMVEGAPTQCNAANNQCSDYVLGYCVASTNTCAQATTTCNSNADCVRGAQQGQCVVYHFKGGSYYDDKYCIYQ